MKSLSTIFAAVLALSPLVSMHGEDVEEESPEVSVVDSYEIKMTLKVPQVVDNMESMGYRKNKTQRIKGFMYVMYYSDGTTGYSFGELTNCDYKVGGSRVTYQAEVDENALYPRWNYIGNNARGIFKTPSVCFSVVAYPSYAKSDPEMDNSLYLTLAGSGTTCLKNGARVPYCISGYVAGTQGCGCTDYGHVSPTRRIGAYGALCGAVDDVAAVYGRWSLKFKGRVTCK